MTVRIVNNRLLKSLPVGPSCIITFTGRSIELYRFMKQTTLLLKMYKLFRHDMIILCYTIKVIMNSRFFLIPFELWETFKIFYAA